MLLPRIVVIMAQKSLREVRMRVLYMDFSPKEKKKDYKKRENTKVRNEKKKKKKIVQKNRIKNRKPCLSQPSPHTQEGKSS